MAREEQVDEASLNLHRLSFVTWCRGEMAGFWTDEKDQSLRAMAANGVSVRVIAAYVGASHVATWKRMRKLCIKAVGSGERAERPRPSAPAASHIESYKSARRGFDVPAHLESQYFELLKAGVSIADACRRLNIKTHQPPEA